MCFGQEFKYLGVYLDCTLMWRKHIEYIIRKFYKSKNDVTHFMYSDEMGIANELLLHKTVLKPTFLYWAPICGSAANVQHTEYTGCSE